MTRPSMPPATVTTWPVTWPDRTGEARTTTWAATSWGCATFRRAIVRETRRTCSSDTWPRVIGDSVQPGATAFTRASGLFARPRSSGSAAARPGSPTWPRRSPRACLADDARRRADEDQRAVSFKLPEETAGSQERRGQVGVERARQRSSDSSQTGESSRGHTPATAAQSRAGPARRRCARPLLLGQVRSDKVRPASELRASPRRGPGPGGSAGRPPHLGGECRAHADPIPRRPRYEHALPLSPVSICGILSVVGANG